MDGMTTLQHLMIHRPTPTIIFSSLSEEGTARSFDTLKNGAIDFISKDFIFQKQQLDMTRKHLVQKVRKAAAIELSPREPILPSSTPHHEPSGEISRLVFCEDCGNRQAVTYKSSNPIKSINCTKCGDVIDLGSAMARQHRRNSFITVMGGGSGSFSNLLEIIPCLTPDICGSIIAVIHQEGDHLNRFTEYLDANSAMKVVRAREGLTIEGGNCYITSGHEFLHLKPFSAQLTLQRLQKTALNCGPFDILLASVSTLYKKRACGIVLSGAEHDGDKGISILAKNGGTALILEASSCYFSEMGAHIKENVPIVKAQSMQNLLATIKTLHNQESSIAEEFEEVEDN
jgi:two-component system, chemotaxis family, protein-glutamate methylesterase/glutaminase